MLENDKGELVPTAVSYKNYPKNGVFEIAGAGFGAVMMTTDLLERVTRGDRLPFSPIMGFSEDLSFCLRVREIGVKMWCDSRINPAHIGTALVDESTWEGR